MMDKKFVTGWMNTDAMNFSTCPRCEQEPGEPCCTPMRRQVNYVHGERTWAYAKKFPERDGMYTGGPNGLSEKRRAMIQEFNENVAREK